MYSHSQLLTKIFPQTPRVLDLFRVIMKEAEEAEWRNGAIRTFCVWPSPHVGPLGSPLFAELTVACPRFRLLKFHRRLGVTVRELGASESKIRCTLPVRSEPGASSGTGERGRRTPSREAQCGGGRGDGGSLVPSVRAFCVTGPGHGAGPAAVQRMRLHLSVSLALW